jgi:hypothetical protein
MLTSSTTTVHISIPIEYHIFTTVKQPLYQEVFISPALGGRYTTLVGTKVTYR